MKNEEVAFNPPLAVKIEIMQAALDGKTIEVKESLNSEWRVIEALNSEGIIWHWPIHCYRIKPEPREFWIMYNPEKRLCTIGNSWNKGHELSRECHFQGEFIHVKEVI